MDKMTFFRTVPVVVDIKAAKAHYSNPEIDFTETERATMLEIVKFIEDGDLDGALGKTIILTRHELEYLRTDIYELIDAYSHGHDIYSADWEKL